MNVRFRWKADVKTINSYVRLILRSQPVDATHALNLLAGVSNSNAFAAVLIFPDIISTHSLYLSTV